MADNRFKRHLEYFGPAKKHILHDPEALGYVLDEHFINRSALAKMAIESAVAYAHEHGLKFIEDHAALAGIIRGSTDEHRWSSHPFDTILKALHEKRNFVRNPLAAAKLYVAMAHASFEVAADTTNKMFFTKIVDTAYLRNEVVTDKAGYFSALDAVSTIGLANPEYLQLSADLQNAKQTFTQLRMAYVPNSEKYSPEQVQYFSRDLSRTSDLTLSSAEQLQTVAQQLASPEGKGLNDFLDRPLLYDPIAIFTIPSGEKTAKSLEDRILPEQIGDAYVQSDLYDKRLKQLAPRAFAHDILNGMLADGRKSVGFDGEWGPNNRVDIPISPGFSITAFVTKRDSIDDEQSTVPLDKVVGHILESGAQKINQISLGATDQRAFAMGTEVFEFSDDDNAYFTIAILRPSVPEDIKEYDPHFGLVTSLKDKVINYTDHEKARNIIDAKKASIRENQHHFLGRRPVTFKLPESYQEHGLDAVEMRQHPDRSHYIVTAHHREGDMEFLFDRNLSYQGRRNDINHQTAINLAFEDLVVSLASAWFCRPTVETSDGPVSTERSGSRVNLGFLGYLAIMEGGKPKNFSSAQAQHFKREQGGNLAAESLRRKAEDPTGQGRNSTYYRESFDPSKPPLEIYYDHTVLPA